MSDQTTRRTLLKVGAAATLVTIAPAVGGHAFFTADEFALVDELMEIIIPADDHSPGARAAQTAAYVDARLAEEFEERPRVLWREGLKRVEVLSKEMSGKAFLESTPEQRVALVMRIARNETDPKTQEDRFFRELKSRTVYAYYSSKIGIHQEMGYKGNTYQEEYSGFPIPSQS